MSIVNFHNCCSILQAQRSFGLPNVYARADVLASVRDCVRARILACAFVCPSPDNEAREASSLLT